MYINACTSTFRVLIAKGNRLGVNEFGTQVLSSTASKWLDLALVHSPEKCLDENIRALGKVQVW